MSLIKCPECGRENVSDTAVSCPECGYAIKEHFDRIKLEEQRIAEEKAFQERREAEERYKKATEGDRQKEAIKRLEENIKSASNEFKKSVIGLFVCTALSILFGVLSDDGSLWLLIALSVGGIIISLIFIGGSCKEKKSAMRDLELAKRSVTEYEEDVRRRGRAYAAQSKANAEKYAANHPKCPMCGSTQTEKIGNISRAASVATLGLASSKIGKQYQCKNCKHKW